MGKGSGPSINIAARQVFDTSQQPLEFSHITGIIFTEKSLKNKAGEFFYALYRFRQIRFTPWVFGTRGDLVDLMNTPPFFSYSAIGTIIHAPEGSYKQLSWIQPLRAVQLFSDLQEPGKTVILPSLGISPEQWLKDAKADPKLLINGAFLIHHDTFIGWLGKDDLSGLRWMTRSSTLTALPIKKDDKVAATLAFSHPKVKIKQTFADGRPAYSIKIKLKGFIAEQIEDIEEAEMIRIAEKSIKEEVLQTFRKAVSMGGDVYQLEYETYVHEYRKWKELSNGGAFPISENSLKDVEVNVKIEHPGMLRK